MTLCTRPIWCITIVILWRSGKKKKLAPPIVLIFHLKSDHPFFCCPPLEAGTGPSCLHSVPEAWVAEWGHPLLHLHFNGNPRWQGRGTNKTSRGKRQQPRKLLSREGKQKIKGKVDIISCTKLIVDWCLRWIQCLGGLVSWTIPQTHFLSVELCGNHTSRIGGWGGGGERDGLHFLPR